MCVSNLHPSLGRTWRFPPPPLPPSRSAPLNDGGGRRCQSLRWRRGARARGGPASPGGGRDFLRRGGAQPRWWRRERGGPAAGTVPTGRGAGPGMEVEKMDENEWKYHGEGNQSLVVSHCQVCVGRPAAGNGRRRAAAPPPSRRARVRGAPPARRRAPSGPGAAPGSPQAGPAGGEGGSRLLGPARCRLRWGPSRWWGLARGGSGRPAPPLAVERRQRAGKPCPSLGRDERAFSVVLPHGWCEVGRRGGGS